MPCEFAAFFNRKDTFALGVCNGCQMMSALKSIIPGAEHWPAFRRNQVEQFEAFIGLAGIVVLTGIVWLSSSLVPAWTWWPGLLLSCVMTLVRGVLIMQYQRQPQRRSTAQWGRGQTVCAAINGLAWGYVTSMMCHHLPLANQFMVLTVAAISASAAATEGFAYYRPSLAFISFSQLPLAFWFLFSEGENHTTLGILLVIFVLVLSWQLVRRHAAFNESLALRFKNERPRLRWRRWNWRCPCPCCDGRGSRFRFPA